MATKKTNTPALDAPAADTRHLVTIVKNGCKADVTSTSLDKWLEKGWKRFDVKAGA